MWTKWGGWYQFNTNSNVGMFFAKGGSHPTVPAWSMVIPRTIIVLIILDHLMRIITPQQCIYPYHDSAMKASGKNLDSQSVLNLIAFKLAIAAYLRQKLYIPQESSISLQAGKCVDKFPAIWLGKSSSSRMEWGTRLASTAQRQLLLNINFCWTSSPVALLTTIFSIHDLTKKEIGRRCAKREAILFVLSRYFRIWNWDQR